MARIVFPPETLPRQDGPDLPGLAEAQDRLRDRLGVDAVFQIPAVKSWPAGTPLDPETQRPFDPFLEPENPTADAEVTVRCSFVHRPLTNADPAATAIGAGDRGDAALIVPLADYPAVRAATRVRVGEDVWDIQQFRYDVALTIPRWIAYLERA